MKWHRRLFITYLILYSISNDIGLFQHPTDGHWNFLSQLSFSWLWKRIFFPQNFNTLLSQKITHRIEFPIKYIGSSEILSSSKLMAKKLNPFHQWTLLLHKILNMSDRNIFDGKYKTKYFVALIDSFLNSFFLLCTKLK